MANKQDLDVSTTSAAYGAMSPRWALLDALLGGTETMRAAGELYLPRHTEETQEQYEKRLDSAVLINMTEQTLEALAGKPFSDPVKLKEDVPDQIRELAEDIDAQGSDLHTFARSLFKAGLAKGFAHVLIDFPEIVQEEGTTRTLADDRKDGLRPYWLLVQPENVIAMHSEFIGGKEVLTHVRIREDELVQDGYGERLVERVRVLEPGRFERWEKSEKTSSQKDEWTLVQEGITSLGFIPLVTFYADRESLMTAKPPLLDLAYLNTAHWQSASDQRNVLTVARFPILAASGLGDDDEGAGQVTVGPNRFLAVPDVQGRFYYVEHTGAAINAGRQDLLDLEERMANFGAEFLKKTPNVFMTASARILNSSEALSKLQAMTLVFVDALDRCLDMTARWLKLEEGGTVEINVEFTGITDGEPATLQTLQETRRNRDISRRGYLRELRRRNILADDFDVDIDLEEIQEENDIFGSPEEILDVGAEDTMDSSLAKGMDQGATDETVEENPEQQG